MRDDDQVRQAIMKIRVRRAAVPERRQSLYTAIMKDLRAAGTLYRNGGDVYGPIKENHRLIHIHPENAALQILFLKRYGLLKGEQEYALAVEYCRVSTLLEGKEKEVYRRVHYDRVGHVLHLFIGEGDVLRIALNERRVVPNGTDGVLFLETPSYERFTLREQPSEKPRVADVIRAGLLFEPWALTAEQQATLLLLWFLALFFPELFRTRPILALVGPPDTFKTSTLRRIGMLIFGRRFDVTKLGHDHRDLEALAVSRDFIALDQVDDGIRGLDDALAALSTGSRLGRRKLYTDDEVYDAELRAFIGISSRTPPFTREDLAQRLTILRCALPPGGKNDNAGESNLQAKAIEERDQFMTDLVPLLQAIVNELTVPFEYRGPVRLADFAQFALVAGRALSIPDVDILLERFVESQSAFTAEDDPFLALLDDLLTANPALLGREMTTAELTKALRDHLRLDENAPEFRVDNAKTVGHQLRRCAATLTKHYGFERRSGHAGTTFVRFKHRANGEKGVISG
jgi:hypothetical protein